MPRLTYVIIAVVSLMLISLLSVCGDNKTTTPTPQTTSIDIADLEAMVEEVAPPQYTGPSAAPSDMDSIWSFSDHPLLPMVFGDEPQSLYKNAAEFSEKLTMLEYVLKVDENGDIVTGTYSDTMDFDGEELIIATTITELTSPTEVPVVAQPLLGETLDLDYIVEVGVVGDEGKDGRIGISLSPTEQTIVGLSASADDSPDLQTDFRYASFNLVDSTFVFKGLGYNEYESGEKFLNAFDISSTTDNDFAYRVCWYNYFPGGDPADRRFWCIIGGGNNQEEFAMKYRVFLPETFTEIDSLNMSEQLFDPNYGEGTGLISDYSDFIDDDLLFNYDVIPQEPIADPWEE